MEILQLFLLITASFCASAQEEEDISIGGIAGKTIQLPCPFPFSSPPLVRWVDFVYNTDQNPSVIFNSDDNEDFLINSKHENALNFRVDSDFSLIISKLEVDSDPGSYICESLVNGTLFKRTYYLTVGTKPECTGQVELREGSITVLQCKSEYSGYQPMLEWFLQSKKISSEDNFEIRQAKRSLNVTAKYTDDRKKYTCRLTIDNVTEECELQLSVKHLVRDLRLTPEVDTLRVGDEVRCSASGNPTPSLSLEPLSRMGDQGEGWKSIVMEREWQDKLMTIKCLASNTLDGKTEILEKSINVTVIEAKKLEETSELSNPKFSLVVVIGIVIVVVVIVLATLVVVIIIIVIRRKNHRDSKGSQPLQSQKELSNGQRGQTV